jgi:hypothetical protein
MFYSDCRVDEANPYPEMCRSPPNKAIGPILLEPDTVRCHTRMIREKVREVPVPARRWRNLFQENPHRDKLRINPRVWIEIVGVRLRHHWLDREGSVPDARVVRTQVPEVGEGVTPR